MGEGYRLRRRDFSPFRIPKLSNSLCQSPDIGERCRLSLSVPTRLNQTNLDAASSRREIKRLDDPVIRQTGIVVKFLDRHVGAGLEQAHATAVIGGEG